MDSTLKDVLSHALALTPALLLNSGVYLSNQIFAARIGTDALLVVSVSFFLPLLMLVFSRSVGPAFNIVAHKSLAEDSANKGSILVSPWFASANSLMFLSGLFFIFSLIVVMPGFLSAYQLNHVPGVETYYLTTIVAATLMFLNSFFTFIMIGTKKVYSVLKQNCILFLGSIAGNTIALTVNTDPGNQLIGIGYVTLAIQGCMFFYQRFIFSTPKLTLAISSPKPFLSRALNIFGWDCLNGYAAIGVPIGVSMMAVQWGGPGLAAALTVGARLDHFLSMGSIAAVNYGYNSLAQSSNNPDKTLAVKKAILKSSLILSGLPLLLAILTAPWWMKVLFHLEQNDQVMVCMASLALCCEFVVTSSHRAVMRVFEKTQILTAIELISGGLFLAGLTYGLMKLDITSPAHGLTLTQILAALVSAILIFRVTASVTHRKYYG